MVRALASLLSSLVLLACAATGPSSLTRAPEAPPVAELSSPLPGVGHRCESPGRCRCRPIDEYGRGQDAAEDVERAPPPEGLKRFELRTGRGLDQMKITVEGIGTFSKDTTSAEPGCIYLDLPPGRHRVRYHVQAHDPLQGVEPRLRISEYSPRFSRWYRTFAFRCASGSEPCTGDEARNALAVLSRVPKGKHDPCGSTRVQGLRFYTERPADAQITDFNLELVLHVYRFVPRFPPDAPRCTGPSAEEP
ncbi:MAG: hypothetical protein RMK29_07815 [Myxococcales bacterium]|nr:hypothetical protein [Myxococcota bacterium]MDW8281600.1 hypothetical protein [Myxococcales bacterium]